MNGKTLIIDVRGEEEAKKFGELKGTVRVRCDISFDPSDCVKKGIDSGAVPKDPSAVGEVVVYCRSGRRAKRFAAELEKLGFENIVTGSLDELKGRFGLDESKSEEKEKVKTLIIDVRSQEESERDGELKGSVRVRCDNSYDAAECVKRGLESGAVPKDTSSVGGVVVYCRSGKRARRFALELEKLGFQNITTGLL
mmetsp:Transcript_10839/g.15006  ORF Transcript_10839/g.15006 Transcript_10839/m.15006 type:complete len:196 (+) Transcript_10839:75-662(+)